MSLSERFQPSKLRDYFVTLTNLLSVKMPGRVTMCYVLLVWRVVPAWTEDVYVKKIESSIPRYQQLQQEQNLTWAELEHIVRHVVEYWTHEPNRTLCIDKLVSQTSRDQLTFLLSEQNSTNRSSVVSPVNERPPLAKVWGFGLLAVGIISLSGLFGGIFLPFLDTKFYSTLMRLLLGLAAGSLTATSTLQLIPEAFRLMDYIDNYIDTSLCMLGSVWALYLFEVFFRIMLHDNKADIVEKVESDGSRTVKNETQLEEEGLLKTTVADNTNSTSKKVTTKIAPVAMMIIFGDGLHNFIDGMSIGAGFSQSLSTGLSMSIAIACEEFPHELGDFAILVNSGMHVKKALLFNFLSACTAFGGLALGIILGELQVNFIFAFAGGLFLYVSLADLFPELNQMIQTDLATSKKKAMKTLVLQCAGALIGIIILYIVTKFF